MKKTLLILLLSIFLTNCEKDDICDSNTETTPLLKINFYKALSPTESLTVTDLKVTKINDTIELDTFTGVSTIQIPLDTNNDETSYTLTLNSNSTTSIKSEVLKFNYTRNQIYVSRACGFRNTFTLNPTNPVEKTTPPVPNVGWISSFEVNNYNIESSSDVHLSIYF